MKKSLLLTMAIAALLGMLLVAALTIPTASAQTTIDSGTTLAKRPLTTFASNALTTTWVGNPIDVSGYDTQEMQYVLDASGVNTITAKLQASNDRVTWTDVATILNGVAADTSGILTDAVPVLLKYNRVNVSSVFTTALPFTLTVSAVLAP